LELSVANSKRKTILNYLRDTTFAQISVANGYNTTPGIIKRGLNEIDSPPDSMFPAIFINVTVENRENITKDKTLARLQVAIEGYVKNSTGVNGLQVDLDDLIEDITKALGQDRTLGGLTAKWLEIKNIKSDQGDADSYGATLILVEIVYTTEDATP
jgi:hypothetical protein